MIDVLIPFSKRYVELQKTLLSLHYQTFDDFRIIISSQFFDPRRLKRMLGFEIRLHSLKGRSLDIYYNAPKGMAQQRSFLLKKSKSRYILYLDDDIILEPWVMERMIKAIQKHRCGFVGQGPLGLGYLDSERPKEQEIEFWRKRVAPEPVAPFTPEWERYKLHNAANLYHVQKRMKVKESKAYKIAWVGGCVLYDRIKLLRSGGFSFWKDLPKNHAGEDAEAQLRTMRRFGGCGLMPSGAYHQNKATTIKDRRVNVPEYLIKHEKTGKRKKNSSPARQRDRGFCIRPAGPCCPEGNIRQG